MFNTNEINELIGKTIISIRGMEKGSAAIYFTCSDGSEMYHEQDCCEYVRVEDVCGDVNRLLNTPILKAEERISRGENNEWGDSSTWTFYALATSKGYVDLRWLGESNGYYSESVDFRRINNRKENTSW